MLRRKPEYTGFVMSQFKILIWIPIVWAVAFGALYQLNSWQADYNADTASIENGIAEEYTYTVTKKFEDRVRRSEAGDQTDRETKHIIHLNGPKTISRTLPLGEWEVINVGDKFQAYHINDRVRVPLLDRGDFDMGLSAVKKLAVFLTVILLGLFSWRWARRDHAPQ